MTDHQVGEGRELLSEDHEPIKVVPDDARRVWEPRLPRRSKKQLERMHDDVREHLRKRREKPDA